MIGTVEYFENFLENSMRKDGSISHETMYRIGFGLFDLIGTGEFTVSQKQQLEQLLNLRTAMNNVSDKLAKAEVV